MTVPVMLVTGGARRIGAEIVRQLVWRGCRVVIHYQRSGREAERLASELNREWPGRVCTVQGDLTDSACPADLIARTLGCWGRLDGLVNNASSFYPTAMGSVTEAEWNELLGSNLKAPFFLAQAAVDPLRQRQGAIVNLVDVYAERPLSGFPVYSIAKAGLAALTRSLAVELAPDVRVNGVAPGAILWPEGGEEDRNERLARIPLGRVGEPADIARTVCFLLFDAPYVTGQVLAVDGGRSVMV